MPQCLDLVRPVADDGFAASRRNADPVLRCHTGGVRYLVWVDAWQLQCCGEPFQIGDDVTWTVSEQHDRDRLDPAVYTGFTGSVTHVEDHHAGLPESWPTTRGRVVTITSAFCRYAATIDDDKTLHAVPGSGLLLKVDRADGWEQQTGDLRFRGYLVALDVEQPG